MRKLKASIDILSTEIIPDSQNILNSALTALTAQIQF